MTVHPRVVTVARDMRGVALGLAGGQADFVRARHEKLRAEFAALWSGYNVIAKFHNVGFYGKRFLERVSDLLNYLNCN